MRGIFDFLAKDSNYTNSEKKWWVLLDRSDCFWYDLIINKPENLDTKKHISDFLKELQKTVERQFEKRFIYFIASRKKVRFSAKRKPRYSFFKRELILYVEIGQEKKLKKIKIPIRDADTKEIIKPLIETCDKFITFEYSSGSKLTFAIHDFLRSYCINLGIGTEVHYIGYTKNPSVRPFNGEHRGLADTFYKVSQNDNDFFLYYNLFNVYSAAVNQNVAVNFWLANSMIDEVQVDEEGRIIEKALILYFKTEPQELNKQSEEAEFENNLIRLAKKQNINSVTVQIEVDNLDEYYNFYSRAVAQSDKHLFICRIVDGAVDVSQDGDLVEMMFAQ